MSNPTLDLKSFLDIHAFVLVKEYEIFGRKALPIGTIVNLIAFNDSQARVKTQDGLEFYIPLDYLSQPIKKVVMVGKSKNLPAKLEPITTRLEVTKELVNFGNLPMYIGDVNYASFTTDADLPGHLLVQLTKLDTPNIEIIDSNYVCDGSIVFNLVKTLLPNREEFVFKFESFGRLGTSQILIFSPY